MQQPNPAESVGVAEGWRSLVVGNNQRNRPTHRRLIGQRITSTRADEAALADGRAVYVGFSLANVNALVPKRKMCQVVDQLCGTMDRGEVAGR